MEAWLTARDGGACTLAWEQLGAVEVDVGRGWSTCTQGAALFAAAFLGWPLERLAWITDDNDKLPPPTYEFGGATQRCVLDGHDVWKECSESWKIREVRDGDRGVQLVRVECYYDDGTREGAGTSMWALRVFAGDRALSIALGWGTVSTIGAVDLGALDVFQTYRTITLPWPQVDPEGVRAILSQLADEVDPSYDVSFDWPARTLEESEWHTTQRYERGTLALAVDAAQFADGSRRVDATVEGLPWGQKIELFCTDNAGVSYATVTLRLAIAVGEAVVARLLRVPGVALNS